ncbi:MAG: hypothetical protein CSA29_02375 [Desulfobacterales bacterium]|nr:MAG: hypothetical protein CSA29_02375 [Desulfobacterales bacterium]
MYERTKLNHFLFFMTVCWAILGEKSGRPMVVMIKFADHNLYALGVRTFFLLAADTNIPNVLGHLIGV